MPYTRISPSCRYSELIAQYRRLHLEGEPRLNLPREMTFPGVSLFPQAARIELLIRRTGAKTLLDYGCGKGQQYEAKSINVPGAGIFETVQDFWNVDYIYCYDPAYPLYTRRPDMRFDGVICTDVLEHCPEEDLEWIIDDIFSFAERFVFASVAGHAAKKVLPNGENAHCTQRMPEWWQKLFERTARSHPGTEWEVWHHQKNEAGGFDEVKIAADASIR